MTAKFGPARKDAVLAALRETGNQTIAAERAKVARSSIIWLRAHDPEFRRLSDEAIAEAKARLGAHPEQRPPRGWGFLDGAELVVRGGRGPGSGKRVQIARARVQQWSPRVEHRFLTALTATCNVNAACAEVGMSKSSAYAHRRQWPAFGRRWKAAIEVGYLQIEMGLIERAGNMFAGVEPVDAAPLTGMTVDHAIHLLHMHKHEVHSLGWRRTHRARRPDVEEVKAEIVRRCEVMRRKDPKRLERDRKEWARRREGGGG